MTGFLSRIVPEVLADVARDDYLEGLPTERASRPLSFAEAIRRRPAGPAVVAEYKRVAPGAAVPRLPPRSIPEFAAAAAEAAVPAVSVLATRPAFEGSPRLVAEVARAVAGPVLFKDIVVHPAQVRAARRAGAAAILLIARLESDGIAPSPLAGLAEAARAAGLEVVLEFHAPGELKVADSVPADVWGVNARDLETLELAPAIAERTVLALRGRRPLLGMSGVRTPADAARWDRLGVDAVLVGTALARAMDPGAFLRSLVGGGPA